jgi:hypothetical protein
MIIAQRQSRGHVVDVTFDVSRHVLVKSLPTILVGLSEFQTARQNKRPLHALQVGRALRLETVHIAKLPYPVQNI